MEEQLALLAVFVLIYSIFAGRVDRSLVSGPIIFVMAGFLMRPLDLGWFSGETPRDTLRILADLTLALFLFTDAANANRRTLERRFGIPARLLLVGLPLSIVMGCALAWLMFDGFSIYAAAILAVMLGATDAALGRPVFTHPNVPDDIREGLNVESGLNDGLCVPLLLILLALEMGQASGVGGGFVTGLLAQELGIGVMVGLVVAYLGTRLLKMSVRHGWINPVWSQVSSMAMALACFAIAESFNASGYIASFSGGMLFGYLAKKNTGEWVHSTEGIAEVLALLTWFLFGYAIIWPLFGQMTFEIVAYALLSLLLVRMLSVLIAMTGSDEPLRARAFMGWFGPRGLASIVFATIVLDAGIAHAEFIALIVVCTVLMSLVLHGVSANYLSERFRH